MHPTKRVLAVGLAASIGLAGFVQTAQAGMVSTEQVAAAQGLVTAAEHREHLTQMLARADVAAALAERGVSTEQAQARVAALTDAEAAQLAAQIDSAPAGASELIGTVVLVFVLLVFSDILGYTHIFPFIHAAH